MTPDLLAILLLERPDLREPVSCEHPGVLPLRVGMAALDGELAAYPERYHGSRVGYPDGDPLASDAPIGALGEPAWKHSVMIVSTVDDPSAVHAHLATLFPGNLCVTQVDHSLAELTQVVARLAGPDGWDLDADSLDALLANRVLVELPVLDEAAVARIGADTAMVEAWPMVRPS